MENTQQPNSKTLYKQRLIETNLLPFLINCPKQTLLIERFYFYHTAHTACDYAGRRKYPFCQHMTAAYRNTDSASWKRLPGPKHAFDVRIRTNIGILKEFNFLRPFSRWQRAAPAYAEKASADKVRGGR